MYFLTGFLEIETFRDICLIGVLFKYNSVAFFTNSFFFEFLSVTTDASVVTTTSLCFSFVIFINLPIYFFRKLHIPYKKLCII